LTSFIPSVYSLISLCCPIWSWTPGIN
jgi:hypothetical protein